MADPIEFQIQGIQCDACEFKDETVPVEQYNQWVNKPCPKYGSNLLTQEDYDNVQLLLETARLMNEIYPPRGEDEDTIHGSIRMNGTGKMFVDLNDEDQG